jgi:hypothetical protein
VGLSACEGPAPNYTDSANDMTMDTNMIAGTNMSEADLDAPAEIQVAEAPTCDHIPASGARLEGRKLSGQGHELRIDNGTNGDAIIKIRDAGTGRLLTSFFVRQHTVAGVSGLPDGSYAFQYAFGRALAAGCKSFTAITAADEFPREGPLLTELVEGGVRIRTAKLTYTLHSVDGGNVQPIAIDANAFNAP